MTGSVPWSQPDAHQFLTTPLDTATPPLSAPWPLGTLAGPIKFTSADGDVFDTNRRPLSSGPREASFAVTFTNVEPRLVRMIFGSKQRIPALWPRMKYRARRRHRGYTRTGRRR